ncbi:gamma-glutamylcyclotransferase [Fibrobacterales bacterium]|nr:gamma-glutamylcyclotransferase [Fibrobacterales bacterium]
MGALFEMDRCEKPTLDKAEELGFGYDEKIVTVTNEAGESHQAIMYYALNIVSGLKPYFWYLNHVIVGAKQIDVPQSYLDILEKTEYLKDSSSSRRNKEQSIYLS